MKGPTRILAVDFGSKRVGIAVTDPLGLTIQPLPFIPYSNRSRFLGDLKKIVREKSVELILLGLPVSLDGTLGPRAAECQKLSGQIKETCGLEVVLYNESYTSREAEEILVNDLDCSRKKRKMVRDSLAAYLLLQSYRESLRSQSGPAA